jgi:hypothetical protein
LIAELEDFTENVDTAGDRVSTATEVSPAAWAKAPQSDYSQIKLPDI